MARIAGIVTSLPADAARAHVASMVASMVHEPFYVTGAYSVPALGAYFGWIDHRERGEQEPVVRRHGNKTLIFAGEHFGDPVGSPSQPRFGVDAAALVAAYEAHGERCFRELNGWFAGVLVDEDLGEIVVFNDRLGMHRVYYGEAAGGFAFASEAKALLAIRPESRQIDLSAVGQWLAVGSVFDERTLFRGVSRMPGGSAWAIRAGQAVGRRRYFSPAELEQQEPLGAREFYDELGNTLGRVVPKYFAGEEPTAVSLTGGFDSRATLAFGSEASPWRLAYTYNGLYRECFDVRVARRVAAACGYRHEVVAIGRDFLARFPEDAEKTVRVTDGTLDLTAAHEVYLSRIARRIAPVRVTGNYGGEVFRRVTTFKPTGLSRAIAAPELLPYLDEALDAFSVMKRHHPVTFAAFDEIPSSLFGRLSAAQSQLIVRTPYTDNALVSLAYRAPRPAGGETDGWTRIIGERAPRLAAIPTDRGKLGGTRWTSRAERLYGYALFKGEWYYDAGMPAWVSRVDAAFAGSRPPFFVGSHKIQHYRLWFRDQAAGYLESLLDGAARRGYLNDARCRRLVPEHRSGARNHVTEISAVATLELVHRVLLDATYPAAAPHAAGQLVS